MSLEDVESSEVCKVMSASQILSAQLKSQSIRKLSPNQARALERQAWSVVPELFQSLVGFERPYLMECACEADSILASTVQTVAKREDAASRCALYNGCDLSSDSGVRLVMQRMDVERPQHVWLRPPGSAFSPLQNSNQADKAQIEALKAKRREAIKIFVGCSCVMHYAIQKGIHVTLELADRSDAWRLPVLNQLHHKYSMFKAVASGCAFNLREPKSGKLIQRGWRILTTHKRLAETFEAPCRCPRTYSHGRCTGKPGFGSSHYTSELAYRVARVLVQEMSHSETLQECQGTSYLCQAFGSGEFCTCGDLSLPNHPRTCANCLLGRQDLESSEGPGVEDKLEMGGQGLLGEGLEGVLKDCEVGEWDESESADFSQEQVDQSEQKAQELLQQKDFKHKSCEQLLQTLPFLNKSRPRQAHEETKPRYLIFGAYSYGNHYGVTRMTYRMKTTCRYLLTYLQHWSSEKVHCSSLVVNDDCRMMVHRDMNNLPGTLNYVIGVTPFQHGELWLEGHCSDPKAPSLNKKLSSGEYKSGHLRSTRQQVVVFDARKWHAVQKWQGHRITIGGYTSRGVQHVTREEVRMLQDCGFQWDQQGGQAEVQAVFPSRAKKGTQLEEEIKRKLYLLHAATGHSSIRNLVNALKRRNVDPLVLRLAEEFQCPICQERKKAQPRQLASLEPLPPKFHTLTADIGHWNCPNSGETQNFMMIVDEGSRFRVAKILTKGNKQTPNAAACLNFLSEGWIQIFGKPRSLRLDPAGSFRASSVEEFCDRNEIYLDIIPGEAHWQIGTAESAIQGLKTVLNKLSTEDASLTAEQAMSLAVSTFNHREMVRGFSPAQHVLGCAPDETGRQILGDRARQEEIILSQPIEDFQKEAELRATAEKALADWQAQQRISRAANSRTRPQHLYHPGDLVYFWRTQESGKGKRSPGTTQGRFLGPARILAMETRRSESGEVRPTHAIWVVRGRHLMKCSPEQLRPASQREELVESLACSDQTPWTYTRLAEEIGGTQYEDISAEVPTAPEWQRAQDVQAEVQPPRSRIRGKRAAPEQPDDLDLEDPDSQEPSQPSSYQRRDRLDGPKREAPAGALWQDDVRENAWAAEETCFWSSEEAAVAIEIEMPQSNRGWDKFFNNPQSYFVGALRRRAVEVSEKRLSPEDREKFREAKNKEVRNFIAAQAFEALPEHLKPSRTQAIGMRWLLTWKPQDNGSVKAKARAILLGYQDPNYEFRSTTAPVMTRQTRQLFLQAAANRRWRIQKGDITGAFLQGREYPTELFCIPCDEILESMNLPAGSVVRLKRACYGLVDAPLEWYRTVSEFLESIGLTRLWSDACAWVWRPQGVLRGMITGHVDDFLFGGSEEDKGWQEVLRLIKERFKWGDWDQDKFVQCGVLIETTHEGFSLSQPHYLSNLEEIHINAQRRKDRTAETTDWEKTQLRALLGGLSWFAQQTGPHLSAEISMMLSEVTRSNVETIVQANLLLQHAKARKDHKICIFRHKDEDMQFYAWVDAANKNRVGDGSTQGIFIGAAPKQLLRGDVCSISPMSWNSTKIDRSCRSPGSAETQAAVNGEDSLFYMRYQWSEMQYGKVNLRSPSAVVKQTGGCLITDSRNVYDKLSTEVLTVQGAEKKSNLELLSVKESQMATHLIVRWVHSEAQLANALTKKGAKELELFYKMRFMWRIVEDPAMRSARRRRQEGLQPFDQTQVQNDCTSVTPETQGNGGHASD